MVLHTNAARVITIFCQLQIISDIEGLGTGQSANWKMFLFLHE